MRSEIMNHLDTNIDYWYYLRENPIWHRILSRHPEQLKAFFADYKVGRKKRVIDKIDDLNALINLAEGFLKR